MTKAHFDRVSKELLNSAAEIANAKRVDYTIGSLDVLANFKNVSARWGITPNQAWGVYAQKHMDAITSIMRNPDRPTSEPPLGRFSDLLNYTLLGWGLLEEGKAERACVPLRPFRGQEVEERVCVVDGFGRPLPE